MNKIAVLGGCGGVGSVAAKTVSLTDHFDEVVIADYRYDAACALADSISRKGLKAASFDASDPVSIGEVIRGSKVVLNCVGPFYRYGPRVLEAVIDAGIDYVDVCDDLDATQEMLALDEKARASGVKALIGMGNSPGLTNVFVRLCAERMLTEISSVDIFHIHGGEPTEGAGVVKHRIHAMMSEIPLFLDGKFISVRMLDESGIKHVEEVDFKGVGRYPVYPYPHPETITIPGNFPGVRRVTNKGFVLPPAYFKLTMDAVRLGICTDEEIEFDGQKAKAIDFAVAFILSKRQALMEEAGLEKPLGCTRVSAAGAKEGETHEYVFSMFSERAGAGEGTGIPAAIGAMLMAEGRIEMEGVFPPEAGVDPNRFLALAGQIIRGTGIGGELPISIEHRLPDGSVESVSLEL